MLPGWCSLEHSPSRSPSSSGAQRFWGEGQFSGLFQQLLLVLGEGPGIQDGIAGFRQGEPPRLCCRVSGRVLVPRRLHSGSVERETEARSWAGIRLSLPSSWSCGCSPLRGTGLRGKAALCQGGWGRARGLGWL